LVYLHESINQSPETVNVQKVHLLKPVHTGDNSRRFWRQFVAENGDCRRKWQLSPKCRFRWQCGQGFW